MNIVVIGGNQLINNMDIKKIVESLAIEIVEGKLCPRGKKYLAARKAAGEKSSAYLSGRAVKVCKGQIKFGGKKKKTWKEEIDPSEAYSNLDSVQTLVDGKRKIAMIALKDQSDAADTIKLINDNGLKKIGIDQRPGDEVYVVYIPGAEADAKEFASLINKYGGYASSKASYEDTKRMGELLGYKKEAVDAYLEKNYDENRQLKESLDNWFNREKWVRIDTQGNIAGDCGTMPKGKPTQRCLPRAKAQSLSKAERAATTRKKIAGSKKGKQFVSNTKKAKVSLEELDLKKAAVAGALALGTLGTPKMAQAQDINKVKDKIKQGISFVQSKLQKKKDEPQNITIPMGPSQGKLKNFDKTREEWSKYNSDSTTFKSFGEAVGQTESAARMAARMNARAQILKKMKTNQATFGSSVVDEAMFQLPNGNYHAMVVMDKN